MRWLHCSDFHIGSDRTAQERLLDKIVGHAADQVSKGFVPDLVFITGDLANKGVNAEYNRFRKDFFDPLRKALGGDDWPGRILAVPGNHDVDRTKADAFDREGTLAAGTRFFDPSAEGKAKREILFPRFKSYRQRAPADVSGNWISDPDGAYAECINIRVIQVGAVGINTAWLSKDDKDQGKLTPGFELTESALEKIQDCQVRFVLGHHPLGWLQEDQAGRLRALFGHHRVIYLHGHLHRAEGRQEDGAGLGFLVLQSGAAFQARDDEPWRNGLLWGEIDLAAEQVRVSPRFWNPDNYDWPVETGRFPENRRETGSDWWTYPLPLKSSQKGLPCRPSWNLPEGWEVLTGERLEAMRRDITTEEAERFFDGAEPDWAFALCPRLPRRAILDELAGQVAGYRGQEKPLVLLLTGPGGEGKSMVLRQAVAAMLAADPDLNLLWHADDTRNLSVKLLDQLPNGPWVIATDAADLTAKPLRQLTAELHRARRTNVRLLLCARDTDWRASGAAKLEWYRHADYRTKQLSGLSEADAALIAAAWADFDATGVPSDPAARAAELHKWDYSLPEHFVDQAPETAIRIARALMGADPGDANLAVNLARIYRKCDEPRAGAEVLESFIGEVGNDRGFWYEWATSAGNSGDYAVNAVLGGWSLADQAAAGPPDNRRAKLSLAGLGVAFGELHGRFRDPRFIAGRGAAAHLGLRLDLDAKSLGYFERHKRDAEEAGARTVDPAEAMDELCAALIAAWEVCGRRDELAERISPPVSMSFSGLARLFGPRLAR